MSNHSTIAIIVFVIFAFLFIGVLLTMSFVLDRRRVKDVHAFIPERSEGAFDHENPKSRMERGIDDHPEDHHEHLTSGADDPRRTVHTHKPGKPDKPHGVA